MYAAWFGLVEPPFAITPDPRYLFLSARHAEALAHLLYGLTESGGFIQLTGEVGTGKTTLVRRLLDQLPDGVDAALVLNPRMTPLEFVRTVNEELHVPLAGTTSLKDHVDALNRHLLDAHARGRRSVLIMDEAQTAPADLLEQLRLLTNLETPRAKLLQIILIGQPELRDTLARRDLRQLAQRITARYHLEPLTRAEVEQYVRHRLSVAGAPGAIFDAGALDAVYAASGGIPRLVNVICDRALLGAYAGERRDVDRSIATRAAHEVLGAGPAARSGPRWPWALASALLLGLAAAALWWLVVREVAPPPVTAVAVPVPSAPAAAAPVAAPEPAPDLAAQLVAGTLPGDTDTAFAALFALWGLSLEGERAPCAQAEAGGLRCMYLQGDWESLRRLDRPAILNLEAPDGTAQQAVLRRLDATQATLQFGATTLSVPLTELDRLWFGEHLVLWRMPPHGPNVLRPGYQGDAVRWLRQQLARHRGLDPALQGDQYDTELRTWVAEFQAERGVKVDGYAGEQTLVQIDAALPAPGTPRLSEG